MVANTFVEMHELREKADYDCSTRWTRKEVNLHIASVAAAFKAWKAIRDEEASQAFLFTLFPKKRR
ncbi:MAG TPA: hypothetical protein VMH81_37400 [Bryobacteraceae bacterium]|nr:hypothetical protein [Bryobacteraceae bacterium]